MKLPCRDCIVLAICIRFEHKRFIPLITVLSDRCSLLYDYLVLKDMGLRFPPLNALQEEKDIFNRGQHPRLIELANYMKWDAELPSFLNPEQKE